MPRAVLLSSILHPYQSHDMFCDVPYLELCLLPRALCVKNLYHSMFISLIQYYLSSTYYGERYQEFLRALQNVMFLCRNISSALYSEKISTRSCIIFVYFTGLIIAPVCVFGLEQRG